MMAIDGWVAKLCDLEKDVSRLSHIALTGSLKSWGLGADYQSHHEAQARPNRPLHTPEPVSASWRCAFLSHHPELLNVVLFCEGSGDKART